MVEEIKKFAYKKGYVHAVANIPESADIDQTMNFISKTANKVICVVQLITGTSLTITGNGKFIFETAGEISFQAFQFNITASGLVEASAGNFSKYVVNITTDASTTAHVYMFFEYDYVLAK